MSRFVLTAQLQLQAPNNVRQVVQQIQSQLSGVNVNVQVQGSAQAQRQLQQVTQSTNQATTAAERMGKAFSLSVRRFAAFSVATRAVSLFTNTLGNAVQDAIDFERQLIKVSQVTGKSISQLRGLTKQITSLSTGFGVASSDLLEVSTVLAQAGLTAEDTAVALRTLAKAALAPNFDSITETAEGAIAILAQFQQGVGALEAQLGSINAVAGAFAVEASDLIDVIRRTGGVFKASGGSLNELLALFTSVRATTRESAESIGTGLRTIFTRIQRPKTIEFLKQFGVELVDLNGKFVGPYEAIKRLSQALAGLGEGDLTFISIAEELGGFRQIGKVLPLLQQFTTAQQALNVATKANDSLTNDAASAQAALAIRIMKVKEEFLALIRSITETSTFQVMANTALSLASALIKIADSIKPLLPLLAALAAFKIAKGLGGFFGGIMSGATSGRTYNKGGKVLGFARGGLVPGSGNRDTVPAMLQPGEFVIRKSSVNKMGAGTLAAMNQNRYANGGRAIVGATQKLKSTKKRDGKYGVNKDVAGAGNIQFDVNDGQIGAFVLTPPKGSEGGYSATQPFPFTLPAGNKYAKISASQAGLSPDEIKGGVNAVINPATYPVFYPGMEEGKRNLENNAKYAAAAHKGFLDGISTGVNSTINSVVSQGLLDLPPGLNTNEKLMTGIVGKIQSDNQVRSTIEGYLFEAMISAFTGATAAGGRANFDFPRSAISQNKDKLGTLFGSQAQVNKLIKAEAKRSYGEVGGNIQRKLANDIINGYKGGVSLRTTGQRKHFGGIIQKFADGGGVGNELPKRSMAFDEDSLIAAAKQRNITVEKLKDMLDQRQSTGWRDFIMSDSEIKKMNLLPKRISSPLLDAVEAAKFERQDRIDEAVKKKTGKSIGDYEGRSREKKIVDATIRRRRYATGGGVGTDTVPALLTPGEFVVNRSSAQRIGYGNLNRMNKVGKYAKGGIVQRFATGTSGSGAKPARPAFDLPAQKLSFEGARKLDVAALKMASVLDRVTAGGFTKLALGLNSLAKSAVGGESVTQKYQRQLVYLNSVLPGFSAIIDENAKLNRRSVAVNIDVVDSMFYNLQQLQKSGASQDKIRSAAEQYVNALAKNSRDIKASNPISIPSAAPSPRRPIQTTSPSATPSGGFATMGATMGSKVGGVNTNTASVNANTKAQNSAAKSAMGVAAGNKMMVASMGVSIVQGFLPALDESSSGALKMAHSILGLITTITAVGFALEAFGVKLNSQSMMDFLGGKGIKGASKFGRSAALQGGRGLMRAGSSVSSLSPTLGKGLTSLGSSLGSASSSIGALTQNATALAGPLIAIAGSAYIATQAFNSVITSLYDYDNQLKGAIDSGNVAKAEEIAGKKAGLEGANVVRAGGATAGAAIGFILGGPIGAAIGAALGAGVATLVTGAISGIFGEAGDRFLAGIGTLFGGATYDSAVALAAAQAGAVKTQKALEQAQKTATSAMNDFSNGSITASEALSRIRSKTAEVSKQEKRTTDFVRENLKNRSQYNGLLSGGSVAGSLGSAAKGSFAGPIGQIAGLLGGEGALRDVYTLGGLLGESSSVRNERLSKENVEQINSSAKQQAEAFNIESPARQAAIRSRIVRGGKTEDIRKEATGDLQSRISELRVLGSDLDLAGDKKGAEAARSAAAQMAEQLDQVNEEIKNIEKEVKRAKESFQAMNLGLRSADATASALSASMSRFTAGLEVGGSTFVSDVEFLQESISSAAQAMNPDEIRDAAQNVANNLRGMGVSPQMVAKFEGNVAAFTQAQANYNQAFENVKNSMKEADFKDLSSDEIKKRMAEELASGLGPGVSDEARENLTKVVKNMNLEDSDIDKIIAGDLSAFGDKLTEEQKKMFEPIQKIAQERAKAEQVLTEFTKKRIDAERNLVAAQQEAIDLLSEGREIQAKYGGQAVSMQEKRGNLLAKSNVEASRLGLTSMRTGDAGELRRRNAEIRGRFSQIESQRTSQGGMAGTAGVTADETQKDLQKAYKTQIDTIRGLIKLEEEQLKITEEKNKLEKDSMESLVKGDVEAFFKQQSAVGATAAIASGDQRLMNQYGAEALGTAALDIKRQQDAGVQTLYGQRLAGAGGLTEAASSAALSARGVTDMRAAQVMAGTTAEEEASKARLRELGGMLGETGELGAEMAEMQVQTATINVNSAQLKFNEVLERGNKAAEKANRAENMPAVAKARGGLIYANRGIFVPRGTDTVPAMLTPGEFVVNRGAVQRGNNLQILQAMNGGAGVSNSDGGAAMMARGGMVRYRQEGSSSPEAPSQGMTNFVAALENFNRVLSENVQSLRDTKISIKLDSTSVSINLNDGGLLKALTGQVKQELFGLIENQFKVVDGGRLKRTDGGIV